MVQVAVTAAPTPNLDWSSLAGPRARGKGELTPPDDGHARLPYRVAGGGGFGLAELEERIDAHGHLGNLEIDSSRKRAMVHYEIGIAIGELSLSADFDALLPWGFINNRPFLRCLHGYALCLWRLSRFDEAERVFWRILAFNPADNQGARFCWQAVRDGERWQDFRDHDPPLDGASRDTGPLLH